MTSDRQGKLLRKICDDFIFSFSDILQGDLGAEGFPPNMRYVAMFPPPAGIGGKAFLESPCAVAKVDLSAGRIGDGSGAPENDFCQPTDTGCDNDSTMVIHWDEPTVTHEIGHTFKMEHASCDHGEDGGGGCEAAPTDFPCPHGGICLSVAEQNEPFGFNTYNMSVLPPKSESGARHAHDYMSYGAGPTWTSPHNYGRISTQLRSILLAQRATASASATGSAYLVSGTIEQAGSVVDLNPIYALPANLPTDEGSGRSASRSSTLTAMCWPAARSMVLR